MLGFDRILIPVDFSPDSMAALKYGVALAKKLQGPQQVCVLYIVDEESQLASSRLGGRGSREQRKELQKIGTEKLDKFVSAIDPGEEEIAYAVVVGSPASKQICKYAEEEKFDIIVLGTSGKGSSFKKLVLGSTVQQVQKRSTVPVLAARDPASHFGEDD